LEEATRMNGKGLIWMAEMEFKIIKGKYTVHYKEIKNYKKETVPRKRKTL